ncbi:hypothetical protein QFZ77_007338 [Paenibacillus sp. V4I3]|uniref:hypothetical protein n=1 Tax=unclassified Paenibacillus TaxID=185978 RepID=UPI002789D339|nr:MULTISPECIES: hypothetical protein [unclassified Paenibacillus]MDQ0878679.1 hypothetical protein [Paenibacillus sp. V4I3]MDQ0885464.1 hypothetical protein [Paenibacillus sp. V4I9]
MKRTAWVVLIAGLSTLALSGCQQAASSVSSTPTAYTKPAAEAGASSGTVNKSSNSQPAVSSTSITQEEAGIKIRVDMPEIKTFLQKSKQGPIVPALKQNAVPQGLAYLEDRKWILVSYYRDDGKPSLLTVIDAGTGQMVKALELYKSGGAPYTGHAGGITASRKHVWISSDKDVNYVNIEDIVKADDGKLTFVGSVKNDTRASFSAYADGILWIGEFAHGTDYPTDKSHYMTNRDDKEHKAWAVGYKLDVATDLPLAKAEQGAVPAVPDYILSLPDSIQGMYIGKDGIWLSQSYGRNNASTLHRYVNSLTVDKPHTTVSVRGKDVPVWFLDSKNLSNKLETPPMSEGLFETNGQLYILFESGATKYRTSSSYALDRIQIMPSKE